MKKKFLVKDFEIKSFWYGSRLANGPEWAYKIIYHSPDGKSVELNKICFRYEDARKYIRQTIKIAEQMLEERSK